MNIVGIYENISMIGQLLNYNHLHFTVGHSNFSLKDKIMDVQSNVTGYIHYKNYSLFKNLPKDCSRITFE